MNLKEIKELISLMNENELTEIEIERNGLKVRLRKGPTGIPESTVEESRVAQPTPTAPSLEESEREAQKAIEIRAPMVGTFYRAPSPDASPFVEVGSSIEVGQVVCIIEAMKLMNEIKSEVKGSIREVSVENGDPVEFGQALFLVEPT